MKGNSEEILVSVITPLYNAEAYIGPAIRSVLAQTHRKWEMLIADDCSTDRSAEAVKRFEDPRIRYLKLEKNSGAAAARNAALAAAKGAYIAFLDSDDLWKPEKLEKQLAFMEENRIGFSFSSYEMLRRRRPNKLVRAPEVLNYGAFMKNTAIGTLTVMLNTELTGPVRLVDVKKDHDSMTWAKLLRSGILAHGYPESLAYYREVEGSISNDKMAALKTHWKNCREIENLSVPRCLYYFAFYGFHAVQKHYF